MTTIEILTTIINTKTPKHVDGYGWVEVERAKEIISAIKILKKL